MGTGLLRALVVLQKVVTVDVETVWKSGWQPEVASVSFLTQGKADGLQEQP